MGRPWKLIHKAVLQNRRFVDDRWYADSYEIRSNRGRRLVHVPHLNELIIVSMMAFRSSFARRYLLSRFDAEVYAHPLFSKGVDLRKQPFFTQADWVTSKGSKIILNMRGGIKLKLIYRKTLPIFPTPLIPSRFLFTGNYMIHKTAQLRDTPSVEKEGARFHLIQTSIPYFSGGSRLHGSRWWQIHE